MHAVSHQLTAEQMAKIAAGLDKAGVGTIEVGHGDGLGGSSLQYGFARATDKEYLEAISKSVKNAKIDVLLIPGIGTGKFIVDSECLIHNIDQDGIDVVGKLEGAATVMWWDKKAKLLNVIRNKERPMFAAKEKGTNVVLFASEH